MRKLSEVQPEAVRWLWPGRIPLGKLTVLDGDPGLGKSTVTLDIASRVTTGQDFPDQSVCLKGGVLLLGGEDGLSDTVRPRLEAAGADLTLVAAEQRLLDLSSKQDLSDLEKMVKKLGAVLVVVDPLVAFLGDTVNTFKDQDVRRALAPVGQLAESTGAAFVLVRHLNKAKSDDRTRAVYRGGGSIGISAIARSVLLVAAQPSDPNARVLAVVKNNLAAPVPSLGFKAEQADLTIQGVLVRVPRLVWGGEVQWRADDLVTGGAHSLTPARDEATGFLKGVLACGPQPAKLVYDLAEQRGIAGKTLERAKEALHVRAAKKAGELDGGWLWVPPWRGDDLRKDDDVQEISEDRQDRQPPTEGAQGVVQRGLV